MLSIRHSKVDVAKIDIPKAQAAKVHAAKVHAAKVHAAKDHAAKVRVPRVAAASAATATALFLVLAPGAPASAETVNPVSGSRGFLVVVEGSAAFADGESDGPIAVGGNLSITSNSYGVAMHGPGTFRTGADARPAALVVGGTVDLGNSTGSLTVGSQGWVKLGDTNGLKVQAQSNGPTRISRGGFDDRSRLELQINQPADAVRQPNAIDFPAMFSAFRQRSAGLATCQNSATLTDLGGGQYRIGLTEGRQNVLNLRSADLPKMANLTFSSRPNQHTPLLINVDASATGGTVDWKVPNFAGIGNVEASAILVNFPNASSVTLPEGAAMLEGSLFAPNAAVVDRSSSNIEGTVVARSLIAGDRGHSAGEVHDSGFAASLNTCSGGTAENSTGPADSASGVKPGASAQASSSPAEASSSAEQSDQAVSPSIAAPSTAAPAGSAASSHRKGGLALTGNNLVVLVLAGLLMIGAGIVVMVLVRHKSANTSDGEPN